MKVLISPFGDVIPMESTEADKRIVAKQRNLARLALLRAEQAFIDGKIEYSDYVLRGRTTKERAKAHCLGFMEAEPIHILEEFLTTGYYWDDFVIIRC